MVPMPGCGRSLMWGSVGGGVHLSYKSINKTHTQVTGALHWRTVRRVSSLSQIISKLCLRVIHRIHIYRIYSCFYRFRFYLMACTLIYDLKLQLFIFVNFSVYSFEYYFISLFLLYSIKFNNNNNSNINNLFIITHTHKNTTTTSSDHA